MIEKYFKDGDKIGVLPNGDWKNLMKNVSKSTLDPTQKYKRFYGCLEPRDIALMARGGPWRTKSKNVFYKKRCEANCPPWVFYRPNECSVYPWDPLVPQKAEVYSYYLPVYSIIISPSPGIPVIDPEGFGGDQNRKENSGKNIGKRYAGERKDRVLKHLIDQKKIPTNLFEAPDYLFEDDFKIHLRRQSLRPRLAEKLPPSARSG